jgi:hypothetical protein
MMIGIRKRSLSVMNLSILPMPSGGRGNPGFCAAPAPSRQGRDCAGAASTKDRTAIFQNRRL